MSNTISMNEQDQRLNAIKYYKMNDMEAQAYKLSLPWLDLVKKYFPNYNHTKYGSAKNDPRKSALFTYCHTVIREKGKELKEEHYRLYIRAQLEIFRAIAQKADEHPIVDLCIISGPNAWKRWCLWKKKYDRTNKTVKHEQIKPKEEEIKKILDNDRIAITNKQPDEAKLKRMFLNKEISPYYIILKDIKTINILNYSLYKNDITPVVIDYFKSLF